jgi:Ala-tRNA(Pro) deacylase
VPGRDLAKTVMILVGDRLAMAVLPANRKVVLQDLVELTGHKHVRVATEAEFASRFPDCEIGAMPPFGNLYGMDVYAAQALSTEERIAFNAGTHTEIVQMAYADFARLVQPHVVDFTT